MFAPASDHRIRLRGPWEFTWLKPPAGTSHVPRTGRIDLPATWWDAFGEATGTVRMSRRFGRPGELDEERVWLEVAVSGGEASVVLNGEWLATAASLAVRIDVTGRLAERNRLDLDLVREEREASGQTLAEVALVISSSA